jgi:solute carrier family 10 (sodium/bile acid cotransporter), member 7
VLPSTLWLGVFFLCALPCTVQSSIALPSAAEGNVAAAACSATVSNMTGFVATPLLFSVTARVGGAPVDLAGLWIVVRQLLLPFVLGHAMRPLLSGWLDRHKRLLVVTDWSSILPVVPAAIFPIRLERLAVASPEHAGAFDTRSLADDRYVLILPRNETGSELNLIMARQERSA